MDKLKNFIDANRDAFKEDEMLPEVTSNVSSKNCRSHGKTVRPYTAYRPLS